MCPGLVQRFFPRPQQQSFTCVCVCVCVCVRVCVNARACVRAIAGQRRRVQHLHRLHWSVGGPWLSLAGPCGMSAWVQVCPPATACLQACRSFAHKPHIQRTCLLAAVSIHAHAPAVAAACLRRVGPLRRPRLPQHVAGHPGVRPGYGPDGGGRPHRLHYHQWGTCAFVLACVAMQRLLVSCFGDPSLVCSCAGAVCVHAAPAAHPCVLSLSACICLWCQVIERSGAARACVSCGKACHSVCGVQGYGNAKRVGHDIERKCVGFPLGAR